MTLTMQIIGLVLLLSISVSLIQITKVLVQLVIVMSRK